MINSFLYAYDANGNVTYDESKEATIEYNHLNLPWHVTTPKGEIKWTYDATGRKLKKEVISANGVSVTYQDGIEIYSDGSIFVNHAEGRMAFYTVDESGQPAPHWQSELVIKDHLGNNRLFLCDKNGNGRIELKGEEASDPDYTEIIQESHYYPFGLAMEGPWNATQWEPSNAYRYNGKELNTDLGLNWYDYGARPVRLPADGMMQG